jgi:hypothetical protein
MHVKKLISVISILIISLACSLIQSAVQEEVIQSTQIETIESETTAVPTNKPTSEIETIPTKSTSLELIEEPTEVSTAVSSGVETLDLTELWSYGLTSIRTGEPLIEEGGEHQQDESLISYGYNLVVDKNGNVLSPRGAPLQGGEKLIRTEEYQNDHNVREYARIYTIMAPIRDAILYHFEEMTQEEWLEITAVLTLNNIKTKDAVETNGRSILSTEQVYDYVASGNAEGSPVMRYLEEAGLELKCLAFQDFDFTNPKGKNHCIEHNIDVGSGIKLP